MSHESPLGGVRWNHSGQMCNGPRPFWIFCRLSNHPPSPPTWYSGKGTPVEFQKPESLVQPLISSFGYWAAHDSVSLSSSRASWSNRIWFLRFLTRHFFENSGVLEKFCFVPAVEFVVRAKKGGSVLLFFSEEASFLISFYPGRDSSRIFKSLV